MAQFYEVLKKEKSGKKTAVVSFLTLEEAKETRNVLSQTSRYADVILGIEEQKKTYRTKIKSIMLFKKGKYSKEKIEDIMSEIEDMLNNGYIFLSRHELKRPAVKKLTSELENL